VVNKRTSLIRTLAAAAALVLAMGLPRLLVLCEHGGEASLEFAVAGGCCHEDGAPGRTPFEGPAAGATECCDHASLAVEMAPTPRPGPGAERDVPPLFGEISPDPNHPPPARQVPPHPPSTGPPREDRRTLLRATSLLLL
jgi:hypothetical protein